MKFSVLYNRITSFIIFIFILNTIIFLNMFNIQIINSNKYSLKSYKNCIRLIPICPIRGNIFDCNGIPIAISNTLYKIEIIPEKIDNLENMILNLKKIINISDLDILNFKKKLNKSVKYLPLSIKENLTEIELSKFSVNKFRFPNIKIKKYYKRYYPYKEILSHVVGYVSRIDNKDVEYIKYKKNYKNYILNEDIGKTGIEKYYEDILRGKLGFKEIEVNNRGKIIKFKNIIKEESGKDIYLSIDLNLSIYIKKILLNNKAAVIVTNPNNGNILSLISNPSFDPNIFTSGISKNNYKNIILNKDFPMLNRATQGIYPPASTIKPYISLYALKNKIITKDYLIYDPGWWKLPNSCKFYKDWNKNGRGWINLDTAIQESSDIFFYELAYKMGIDNLYKYMSKFGYNDYVNIDILEEKKGVMPNKEWKLNKFGINWYTGDTISVGIGQGYWSTTPLQMARSLSILINNGVIKNLHLLNYIYDNANGSTFYFKNKEDVYFDNDIIDNNLWKIIKRCMYKVANNDKGTAFNAFKNSKYKVAAKTGTAQVYNLKYKFKNNKVPDHLKNHKLMISFAPFKDPKLSVVVVLENGGNKNVTVGNVTRRIFDYMIINNKY